jgi:hypothetical protein
MIMTGVMGEYVWRALDEVRARPRYIVEEILGFTTEHENATTPSLSNCSDTRQG